MKHALLKIMAGTLLLFAAAACARHRIIPDRELAMIFHDAFLANAYVSNSHIDADTVDVYGPIFEQYGYTAEDVLYTIGNFSKRKSARLSDVVNAAIERLSDESSAYKQRVLALDTIDAMGRRMFARTVRTDSLLRISRVKDTAGMVVVIPVDFPGDYEVSMRYLVDSTDRNNNLRFDMSMVDSRGAHRQSVVHRLRRNSTESYSHTFTADTTIRSLVLDLNPYGSKVESPSLRIDSLLVRHYLPADMAFDSLYRMMFDYSFPQRPGQTAADSTACNRQDEE